MADHYLAIDLEWRTDFAISQDTPIAVIQLASATCATWAFPLSSSNCCG